MIIGIGTDLVEVQRVERLVARVDGRGERRVFTAAEAAYCRQARQPAESFAARFAAKEAYFKALGTGWGRGGAWTEVEVVSEPSGVPSLRLHGVARANAAAAGVQRLHLSLTHTRALAGAYVILEG